MTDKKAWKQLRKQLENLGCNIQPQKNTHLKVILDGQIITVIQQSASCPRAYLNKVKELQRKGLNVK